MDRETTERLDDCWRAITRCEEFIRLNGHTPDANWEDRWSNDLESNYAGVETFLAPISRPRMIHSLPGALNPFAADNCLHALVLFLNPPERWFGQVAVLDSPEYAALKSAAADEESLLDDDKRVIHTQDATRNSTCDSARPQPIELTETEQDVFDAIDSTPMQTKEIEIILNTNHGNIGRHLSLLKRLNLIERTPLGYRRT